LVRPRDCSRNSAQYSLFSCALPPRACSAAPLPPSAAPAPPPPTVSCSSVTPRCATLLLDQVGLHAHFTLNAAAAFGMVGLLAASEGGLSDLVLVELHGGAAAHVLARRLQAHPFQLRAQRLLRARHRHRPQQRAESSQSRVVAHRAFAGVNGAAACCRRPGRATTAPPA